MNVIRLSRLLGFLLAMVLAIAACSDDPNEIVVGAETDISSEPGDEELSSSEESGTPASTTTTTLDTDTATSSTTTSTTATSTTTSTAIVEKVEPTTTTTTTAELPIEVTDLLGPAMIGNGEWVVLRNPKAEGVEECSAVGILAYAVDDEIVHRYDELGDVGSIRLFNGPRGQDAFVINCEESVERVLLQGSAIMPDTGWPELTDITLYGDGANDIYIGFTSEIAWRGDVFGAYATLGSPGREELVAFDTVTGAIEPFADRIGGTRTAVDAVHGVDVVVPEGWLFQDTDGIVTLSSPTSLSRLQVHLVPVVKELPTEGDELLSSDSIQTRLWTRPTTEGHSRVSQVVQATDTSFSTLDGFRLVRHVPIGGAVIEIEMFIDDAESGATQDLPWLILDLLRVIDPASS